MNTKEILSGITYGADPEVFATYNGRGGNYCIPPIAFETLYKVKPIIPDEKHPVYIDNQYFQWHMDGAAFELRIKHPYRSFSSLYNVIQDAKSILSGWLKSYDYSLTVKPTVLFNTKRFWDKQDERFRQCVIFGCDADFDIFDPNYVCKTIDVSTYPYRHGGGHIHIGHTDKGIARTFHKYLYPFMQLLTIYVGNTCLAFSKYPEEEKLRSGNYGKPGKHRLPAYGVEYRTPSNSWLNVYDNNYYHIHNGIRKSVELLLNSVAGKRAIEAHFETANKAILEANKPLAVDLFNIIWRY